jgi:hypothetical protein
MKQWTEQHIQQLKEQGRIVDYKENGRTHATPPNLPNTAVKKRSKEKSKLTWDLKLYCEENGLLLVPELSFHKFRKWRFDFGIFSGVTIEQVKRMEWNAENQVAAVEWNGIMSEKSRHTTVRGYSCDMEKLNAAQSLGWIVLQYTPLNYQNVLSDFKNLKSKT